MNNLITTCPICAGGINLPEGIEVSEIIKCGECNNRLVVQAIADAQVTLNEAPKIEEDWGQ